MTQYVGLDVSPHVLESLSTESPISGQSARSANAALSNFWKFLQYWIIMIVIGTGAVESYLTDHASHKGIKAARSQYEAWLDIVTRANWRNPEDIKAAYPKASILKSSRVVFNIKGNDYRLVAAARPIPCRSPRNPIFRHPCRI